MRPSFSCALFLAALLSVVSLTAPAFAEEPSGSNRAASSGDQPVCLLLESAARSNGLPIEYFVRLIWRESRFKPGAVGPRTRSGRHALGIAQFMPRTAAERDLLDPFNPIEALPKAAEFLKDLRDQFGNLGLAAAAYNAGPRRVRDWLAGTGGMPSETRAYVKAVTGNTIEEWASAADLQQDDHGTGCETVVASLSQSPSPFVTALRQKVFTGTMQVWGAILGARRSRAEILDKYAALQRRFAAVLSERDPILLDRGARVFSRYQVRVGAPTRTAANEICNQIHRAGGDCVVLRNG
jgi:hypothetical protein